MTDAEHAGKGLPSAQDGGSREGQDDLAVLLSSVARELQVQHDAARVLDVLVRSALRVVPGAQEGSVSVVRARRKVEAQAASSELPREVDALQEQTGQGPCLDAVYEQQTTRVTDMATESRWPDFSRRAAALGVGSMLSLQLFVEGDNLGALNLYAREAGAFDDASEHVGLLFASHAAVAYAGVQREAGLERALATRQVIGQAQGVLMEREHLSAEQAFEQLVQVSQTRNVKLHDVAERLVATGELGGPRR